MVPDLGEPVGRYLSEAEREEISLGWAAGKRKAQIAREIGRDRCTVGRELARNRLISGDGRSLEPHSAPREGAHGPRAMPQHERLQYRAHAAQAKAEARARRPKPTKLATVAALAEQVQTRLDQRWSPQQIAATLRREHPENPEMWVSHETIYQELYVQGRGSLRRELHQCLRTGRAVRRPRRLGRDQRGRRQLPPEVMISERPAEAEDRAVPGHWEGDLILGAANASAIGTLVERSTRFVMLLHLPDGHHAEAVRDAMITAIADLPAALRRSLAWDQGSEMARHHEIRAATDMPIFFCDPHSPWQRGTNENTNGLLRQYFPKSSDLARHDAEHLAAVAAELNARPRRTLDWNTPAHTLHQLLSPPTNPGVATTP